MYSDAEARSETPDTAGNKLNPKIYFDPGIETRTLLRNLLY